MKTPISSQGFKELFDYAWWARDRQLEACAPLPREQFLRPLGGSFASLRDTLAHCLGVEWIWLERWRGRSPKALPSASEFPGLESIRERWLAVEVEMKGFLAGLDNETLGRSIECAGTRGNLWRQPLWRFILHLLNHQSYHRGQVTNYLRRLGVNPPRVDFLAAHDEGLRP
jgi:uncharacterized damage-inducible protein DinB